MIDNLTVIIPSHNTLQHLKNTYVSVRKYYSTLKLIIVDDASTDGTSEWLQELKDPNSIVIVDPVRRGHTYWYDEGVRMATTDMISILHSDMMVGPHYFENLIKHLEKKTVVSATRIEPPIHPPGREKILQNFGLNHDDYDPDAFEQFCLNEQVKERGCVTQGIFAPWLLYKEDYLRIGGHDQNFAPYGYEDSDIFNRWILAGYKMIQSRDSFVYHLTCRGHRWNKGIGIENSDYKDTMKRGQRYFIRKWNQWIQNDEYMMPIISPRYDICLILKNIQRIDLLSELEPWARKIYIDNELLLNEYIKIEQPTCPIDLSSRLSLLSNEDDKLTRSDVYVILDCKTVTNDDFHNVLKMNNILQQLENTDVAGTYEIGNLIVKINKLENTIETLIQT